MRNNLPELHISLGREGIHKDPSQKKMAAPPRINVRGITLREYFRLCDEGRHDHTLREVEECPAEEHSLPETPTFHHPHSKRQMRLKIKTEVSEEALDSSTKGLQCRGEETTNRSINLVFNGRALREGGKKKESRKKLLVNFHSGKHQEANSSVLGYISQLEDNKNKMLRKIENERERINDLRLSDAFFISKYSKFRLDPKDK